MPRRLATLLMAMALSLSACLDAGVSPAPATPTGAPEPTPSTTTYPLGTTVWYEGLVLHFDQATATLDARGGPVDVVLRIQNPTEEASPLDGAIRLVIGSTRVEANRESAVPQVAAGGSASLVLTYELQGIASVDDAVIEVGAAPLHVARVPLTAAGGEAVALEPTAIKVAGSATAADLKVTLRSALLRWDLPDWSQELDAKLAVLTLTYDVTYAGDFAGGTSFTGENVALRLPDGTVVDERRDGHSQSVELIGPRKTKKGLISRYEIPFDTTGNLALVIRSGTAQKAIVFAIGG
jgi:hypothetical protein